MGRLECEIVIDAACEERVTVYARERSALVEEIERLTRQYSSELYGYKGNEIVRLALSDIHCITVADNKVYAVCDRDRYQLKERLYTLEEKLPDSFVKINQSCLANVRHMERFDTSISGTLKICFKNGYVDYVSRRQLKTIKERLGI